jgi:tyrosinase
MASKVRREALKRGAALMFGASMPFGQAHAQPKGEPKKGETKKPPVPPGLVVLRKSVGTMAVDDPMLDSYRTAIRAMQALPSSDPRNWTRQAQIHQNFCPHGNWYFLPWHRAYLVAFEKICRQLSKNPHFALPYWDWTSTRQLPAAFTTPTYQGQPNPLYNSTRTVSNTFSLPDNMVGPSVISSILAEPQFEVFASSRAAGQTDTNSSWQRRRGIDGPLESNPHNRVHGAIGGNMGTYMSPLDPIFWLHHCNADRIWQEWNDAGHANTNHNLWLDYAFNGNFANADGTPFNPKVADLQNIVRLGYRYKLDGLKPPVFDLFQMSKTPLPRPFAFEKLVSAPRTAVGAPARLNVALSTNVAMSAGQAKAVGTIRPLDLSTVKSMTTAPRFPARVMAVIGDMAPPAQGNSEVRVFLNCEYLSPETPTTDPSYVTSFTFFGGDHAAHGGNMSVVVDLTSAVANLRRAQKPVGDRLQVQLMPVAVPGTKAQDVTFKPGYVQVEVL